MIYIYIYTLYIYTIYIYTIYVYMFEFTYYIYIYTIHIYIYIYIHYIQIYIYIHIYLNIDDIRDTYTTRHVLHVTWRLQGAQGLPRCQEGGRAEGPVGEMKRLGKLGKSPQNDAEQ